MTWLVIKLPINLQELQELQHKIVWRQLMSKKNKCLKKCICRKLQKITQNY